MEGEIYRAMGGCAATHLINLLIDPIPANQRLDVAPDQEGGENQEDEEPGEQESQAHTAERGRGGAGRGFANPSRQEGTCPSSCSPAAPFRAQARRAGQGPGSWVCRAEAAEAASSQGGVASPKPAGAGGGFKSFSAGMAPSPSLGFAWVFWGVCEMEQPPSTQRDAYTRRNLAPTSPRHSKSLGSSRLESPYAPRAIPVTLQRRMRRMMEHSTVPAIHLEGRAAGHNLEMWG